jgi:hypothetical protein
MTTEQKFWSFVDKNGPVCIHHTLGNIGQCWLWTGGKTTAGYGLMSFGVPKKPFYAHRYCWQIHNGPIPDGMYICHKCDVPSCVFPGHLFLDTPRGNTLDALAKGRLAPQRETFKRSWQEEWSDRRGENVKHKLSEDEVREIRALYKKGVFGFKRIVKQFGISHGVAQRIVARKTWAHIK